MYAAPSPESRAGRGLQVYQRTQPPNLTRLRPIALSPRPECATPGERLLRARVALEQGHMLAPRRLTHIQIYTHTNLQSLPPAHLHTFRPSSIHTFKQHSCRARPGENDFASIDRGVAPPCLRLLPHSDLDTVVGPCEDRRSEGPGSGASYPLPLPETSATRRRGNSPCLSP